MNHIIGNSEATHGGRQVLLACREVTATIEMCLLSIAAVAYGRHVKRDLRWTLEGTVLTQTIVGGTPANSFRKVIAKFGARQCYQVVEFQTDYLLVSDSNAESEPIRWNAVSPVKQAAFDQKIRRCSDAHHGPNWSPGCD